MACCSQNAPAALGGRHHVAKYDQAHEGFEGLVHHDPGQKNTWHGFVIQQSSNEK